MSEKKTDRRIEKTRKALRYAFAELLSEKELHKITVQEIADKADVNRVTFYKHYLDVYDLYEKIESETLVELGLLMLQLENLPSEEFFSNLIDYIQSSGAVFKMIFCPNSPGQLKNKLCNMIEGILRQIQSEKTSADIQDKGLEYICTYRAEGCLAIISKWVLGDFTEPKKFIIDIISDIDEMFRNFKKFCRI